VNRFKVFSIEDIRDNGEGVQFSDGTTVLRIDGVMITYPKEVQGQVTGLLEMQGLRLEWMDY